MRNLGAERVALVKAEDVVDAGGGFGLGRVEGDDRTIRETGAFAEGSWRCKHGVLVSHKYRREAGSFSIAHSAL